MLTIKPSSTRLPAPWALCTDVSRLDCYLRAGVSLLIVLATSQSVSLLWPSSLGGATGCSLTGMMMMGWLWHQRPTRTALSHDGAGRWSMRGANHNYHGHLCPGGYCSQWVIVIAIQAEAKTGYRGGVQRCIVWRDAVKPRDFSYLQLMMMTTSSSIGSSTTSSNDRGSTPA